MEPLNEKELRIKAGDVPAHVAVIMDGNGRWAKARGMPRIAGHTEGARSVRSVTRTARRIGCKALTLYAFSAQNWSRPHDEVNGLMRLLRDYLHKERDELIETDIRLNAVGDLDRLPPKVREVLDRICTETSSCKSMVLTLCLSYGGREEIVHMARSLLLRATEENIDPSEVDEKMLSSHLWTGNLPEPDLIIRTSGEMRLSNFLLWGCAYSEMVFVPILWPDFREIEFLSAIAEYQKRERRFGKACT